MAGHAATSTTASLPRRSDDPSARSKGAFDYRDCNHDLLDARETDVLRSSAHCGACGVPCSGTCADGVCVARSKGAEKETDWRAPKKLFRIGPTDVAFGARGEVSLLAFEADADAIESWRYEACVAERVCADRAMAQPQGDAPETPAVGMRWEDADAFCKARGMSAQTPLQDRAIRDAGAPSPGADRFDSKLASSLVTAGFRCTRLLPDP